MRGYRRAGRLFGPILERRTLLAVLAVAAFAWAFAQLYDEAREGESLDFDHQVLLLLRDPVDPRQPWGPVWLESAVRDVTGLGGTTVIVFATLVSAGYLGLRGKHGAAGFLLVAILGAVLLGFGLKAMLDRARPDIVPHGMETFTSSFPSGHATAAAATYLTLGALLARFQESRRLKVYVLSVAVVLAVAIGLSRIYLGVHWPTDVLAGWTLGSGWALACWAMARLLQRRGKIETEPETPA